MDPNSKVSAKKAYEIKTLCSQHPLPLTFLQKVNMQWFQKAKKSQEQQYHEWLLLVPPCVFFRLVLTFFDLKFPLFSEWPLVPQCGKWPMAGVVTVQRQDAGRVTPMSCSANWREGSPFISLSGKQLDKQTVTKQFRYLKWRYSPI